MIGKVISAVVALLFAAALVWWFDDRIEAHYQRPLIEAHAAAIEAQKDANALAANVLVEKKVAIKTVYVDRVKTIEVYAKTLIPNAACLADAAFISVYNNPHQR